MGGTRLLRGAAGLGAGVLLVGLMEAGAVAAAGPTTWQVDAGTGDATGVAGLSFYPGAFTIDAGDSVTFKVAGNAHTVSFLAPGQTAPSPDDPAALAKAGGSTVDGTTFVSSGIVLPAPGQDTVTYTFPNAGTYAFHCLIHPGMDGTVTVNAAGAPYPQDQAAITAAAQSAESADLAKGHQLEAGFKPTSTTNADGSKTWHLAAGVGVPHVTILRFISSKLSIHVGDTVEWTNADGSGEPHSVSFGTEPSDPAAAQGPAGGKTYAGGSGFVSSGLFLGPGLPGPKTYSLTFTKAGTYKYFCVLHDIIGMTGAITVSAVTSGGGSGGSGGSGGATLPPTSASDPGSSQPAGASSWLLAAILGAGALAGAAAVILARRRAT